MTVYSLFGHPLSSDLSFPELPPHPAATPRWQIRLLSKWDPQGPATLIREAITPTCSIRLYRIPGGFWLEHRCTGNYLVSEDGSRIDYQPNREANPETVRLDLLGRVMALAVQAGGSMCLHGSAIQVDQGVLAFIAPKGFGKSTLASALVKAGARLVSDDMVVVDPGCPAMVLPGVPRLRLRDDSFEILRGVCPAARGPDGKQVITELPEVSRMVAPAPLAAVYCITPVPPSAEGPAVTREELSAGDAARALVPLSKNAIILGQLETFDVLELAFAIRRNAPVYRLNVSRELDRIGEVAHQLVTWHNSGALLTPSLP